MADEMVEMAGGVPGAETGLQQQAADRKPGAEALEMAGHGHGQTVRMHGLLAQAAFNLSLRAYSAKALGARRSSARADRTADLHTSVQCMGSGLWCAAIGDEPRDPAIAPGLFGEMAPRPAPGSRRNPRFVLAGRLIEAASRRLGRGGAL